MFARFTRALTRATCIGTQLCSDDFPSSKTLVQLKPSVPPGEAGILALAQPTDEGVTAGDDVLSGTKLIVGVRLGGVTWPEVHRWYAHRAEARHIGPTQLGSGLTANRT